MRRRPASLTALSVAISLAAGCTGYQLGTMLPPTVRTVCVPTFVNRTDEPLVEVDATRETITRLQTDASLRVVGKEEADALLKVTLERYTLTPISYSRDRDARPNEYRIILTASFVMTDAGTGEVLAESPNVEGEATVDVVADLASAKRSALPTAARDLAHDLVESIVESWR